MALHYHNYIEGENVRDKSYALCDKPICSSKWANEILTPPFVLVQEKDLAFYLGG